MKTTVLRLLTGAAVTFATAGIGIGAADADPVAPLTATPSSGLVDGDTVRLNATGLVPSGSALVFQCANATADGTALPLGATGYCSAPVTAPTDAAGRLVDFPFVVKQAGIANPRNGNQGSCITTGAAFPCHVLVASGSQQLVSDLQFGPAPTAPPTAPPAEPVRTPAVVADPGSPAPKAPSGSMQAAAQAAPTVTVNPYTGLKDGQVVKVSGSGFPPGTTIVILQCGNADGDGKPLPSGTSSGHCGTPPVTKVSDPSGNVAAFDFTVKTSFHNKPQTKDVKCIENGNFPCYIMMAEAKENGAEDHQDIFFGNAQPPGSGNTNTGNTSTTTGNNNGGSTTSSTTSSGGATAAGGATTSGATASGGSTAGTNTARGTGSGLASTGLDALQLLAVGGAALALGGGLVRAGRRRSADGALG